MENVQFPWLRGLAETAQACAGLIAGLAPRLPLLQVGTWPELCGCCVAEPDAPALLHSCLSLPVRVPSVLCLLLCAAGHEHWCSTASSAWSCCGHPPPPPHLPPPPWGPCRGCSARVVSVPSELGWWLRAGSEVATELPGGHPWESQENPQEPLAEKSPRADKG